MKFRVIAAALLLSGQASAQLPPKKPDCNALQGGRGDRLHGQVR